MASALRVGGALANWGPGAPDEEFMAYLASGAPDVPVFKLVPPPGHIMHAALDWQAILGTGADLIAYGSLLWSAYERFVLPRLRDRDSAQPSPFLFVTIRRPDGGFAQFQLGREYGSESEFVADFARQATALRESDDGPDDLELLWHFEHDEKWVRQAPAPRHS